MDREMLKLTQHLQLGLFQRRDQSDFLTLGHYADETYRRGTGAFCMMVLFAGCAHQSDTKIRISTIWSGGRGEGASGSPDENFGYTYGVT
jgi:hypothetical protein